MARLELDTAWDPRTLDDAPLPGSALALEPMDALEPPPFDDGAGWDPGDAVPLPTAADFEGERPIPRVTIEAFCERPDVLRAVSAAASDRRMAKATVNAHAGGVGAAIERLSAQASPNLIIIDSAAPAQALLASLNDLSQVVDGSAKVMVIGATNDIMLYRELMRRGVSEYLVAPVTAVQIIRAVGGMFADPDKPFLGRAAAVVGAKGGVGASTVAHNLAFTLADTFAANTTLVDLDLAFGTASLDFNQDVPAHFGDALLKADQIDETLLERMLVRSGERLSLFMAPGTLERWYEFEAGAYEQVLDRLRRYSPFLVLDVPHVWTEWARHALLSADDVLIVTSPDLAGLRNCKNLYDTLKAARPNDAPPQVILNMAGVPKRPEIPAADFADALGAAPFLTIPFDPGVFGQAANNGQMLAEVAPDGVGAKAIEAIARALCGREPAPKPKKSLLNLLLKR